MWNFSIIHAWAATLTSLLPEPEDEPEPHPAATIVISVQAPSAAIILRLLLIPRLFCVSIHSEPVPARRAAAAGDAAILHLFPSITP
jgi:hypothetical protein